MLPVAAAVSHSSGKGGSGQRGLEPLRRRRVARRRPARSVSGRVWVIRLGTVQHAPRMRRKDGPKDEHIWKPKNRAFLYMPMPNFTENTDFSTSQCDREVARRARRKRVYRELAPVIVWRLNHLGPMTIRQIADAVYWSISPSQRLRVAARFGATRSEMSAIRRVVARLVRAQKVWIIDRYRRYNVYDRRLENYIPRSPRHFQKHWRRKGKSIGNQRIATKRRSGN